MVDAGFLLTTAGTIAILLGVGIGIRELRHFSKVREAEVLRDILAQATSAEGLKNFFLVSRMEAKSFNEIEGKPEEVALFQWLVYLEGLGLMVKRRVVSLDVVDDYQHGVIRVVWTKGEALVRSYREQYHHPEFGEWAEYLYLRIYGRTEGEKRAAWALEKKLYSKRL